MNAKTQIKVAKFNKDNNYIDDLVLSKLDKFNVN